MGRRIGVVQHLNGVVNPNVLLCQEYTMLTGGYDETARVRMDRGSVSFSDLVEQRGSARAAVEAVGGCYWMSGTDVWAMFNYPDDADDVIDCRECAEVRHA